VNSSIPPYLFRIVIVYRPPEINTIIYIYYIHLFYIMPRMAKRLVSLDDRTERIIEMMVPAIWPSRSELIRDLVRREAERRELEVMV
jgi:hypothetical protein